MGKSLRELLSVLDEYRLIGDSDLVVKGISDDSRLVKDGFIFIAHAGVKSDGYAYINDALNKGAAVVLSDKEIGGLPAALVVVPDSKAAMRKLVPYFFDYPGKKMFMIGVTGTNGKTTVTYMLRSIFTAAGHKSGLIGTIQAISGDRKLPVRNTTPDVVELQTLLAGMYEDGVKYIFMEVSSHALALNRIAGCQFNAAVLTNITQDHLDFHQTFAAYAAAKTLLFSELNAQTGRAVINNDDMSASIVRGAAGAPALLYGAGAGNDIFPLKIELGAKGMELTLATPAGDLALSVAVTGRFNVYNVMAAVGAALAAGLPLDAIRRGMSLFKGVPGRFELVESGQPFAVIVDYAHTPDGLANVLASARGIAQKRLIAVFGCGGDRDKGKRPLMGEIAGRLADRVFITSDNPRSEAAEDIIADIEKGVPEGASYTLVTDRRAAIGQALALAGAGDVVVIAGKGHETYQILKDKTVAFDDRQVAREFLKGKYKPC